MNYYEKIIQDKNNALREYLEVPFYTYTGRKIQKLDDLNYFIKETERIIDSHKKRKDLEGKGKETLQKAEKNVMEAKEHIKKYGEYYTGSKINSKGETNMGYYADLIKQKQEKRNSAESHLKGLIGKKFKRDTDLERAVNGSIYTEISDWSHPRMIVFDKYSDEKFYVTTEDNHQYGKDQEFWISKVQKANEKEEKENAKTVNFLGQTYTFGEDKRKNSEIWQKLMRDGSNAREKAQDEYKRATREASEKYRKIDSDIGRQIDSLYSQLKEVLNSKEEKDNANFHYLGKSYSVTEGNYKEVRRQIERDYKEEVSKLERKISSASGSEKSSLESKLRDLKSGFKETMEEFDWGYGNEKEEGYYAKLAEEKAERKNYKFTDKEISDYLKSNPSQAKQYVRKKTAGKAENITIHPETLTAELDENGKTHLFKFVSDESLGFILKYMGTK